MGWFSSIIVGCLTALLGGVGAGFIATKCVRWYRISSFEGASGYYVVMIAFLGIVAGLAIGIICARVVAAGEAPGFPKALGIATGSLSGLMLVVGLLAWVSADIAPKIEGRPLELEVEVRCPPTFQLPVPEEHQAPFAGVYVPHGRFQPTVDLNLADAKEMDGKLSLTATVPLETSAANRYLRFYLNKENDFTFGIRLARRPSRSDFEWSKWVDSAWAVGTSQPPPDERFNMRFRVKQAEPPPPVPTEAEAVVQEAEDRQAAFDAIPADAPLSAWFPYTEYGADENRRAVAITRMTARASFAAELGELMVADDAEIAAEAMRLVDHLPPSGDSLNAAVTAAGRSIAERLRKVNTITPEDDPSYQAAAEISIRFSAWIDAARALREKSGGDFTPELREILELSRVRDDSQALRRDVRRVASYYMQQWAGLEPVPGDPPPR